MQREMTQQMPAARRGVDRFADALGTAERFLGAALMIVMTALYGFNVLARLVAPTYASAFAWIDEAARYMMVWVTFVAAGLALELGRHVSVDVFQDRFRPAMRRALFAAIDLVGLVFCLGAMYVALKLTLFVADTGQISPTLGVPAWILYAAPSAGFASLAFRFALRLAGVRDARRAKPAPDWLGSEAA